MKYTKPELNKEMLAIAEDIMADSVAADGTDSTVVTDGANVETVTPNSNLVIG
ncbi:MAG: hypothetical protein KBT46_02210 [Ruminococcus sp.]|nr:hypothetical protein [Candidatus Copronaster equi]